MRSIDKGMNWTKASTKTPIYDLNFIVKKSNNVMKYFIGILFFVNTFSIVVAQNLENDPNALDYVSSKTYTLAGIKVEGTEFYDANVIRSLTGLIVGQEIEIPGEAVSRAIRKLWDNNLFANISFEIEEIRGNEIFLLLKITEKPRLSELVINGIKGSDKDDILEKLENLKRRPVTEGLKISINNTIEDFFFEKGFLKPTIVITEEKDTVQLNATNIIVDVEKGLKIKIQEIAFIGTDKGEVGKMKKSMKNTREKAHFQILKRSPNINDDRTNKDKIVDALYTAANLNIASIQEFFASRTNPNIFKSSKFNEDNFETDKKALIDYYNSIGYRDAKIVRDTFYYVDAGNIKIEIEIDEGQRYHFRNITWKGNAKYNDQVLSAILGIKKGDIYNAQLLQSKLEMDPNGTDISSLYYDDGYLFFQVIPKEVAIVGDSIDIEIRINEGPQATIKNIIIKGNDKTNEHVIRREIRTLPGDKFSRTALIRSQREIANLGFFDAEQIGVVPIPNAADGTVDIEYTVVEKSADQVELSAGWGGNQGLIGTLGLSFNNFSIKNIFKKGSWSPLPTGDGQKFSVRIQSNGKRYQSYNFSFTEPWLGGKRKNPFTVSWFRTRFQNLDSNNEASGSQITNGATVALGTQLKKPDDNFFFQGSLSYQNYKLKDFGTVVGDVVIQDGSFNNFSIGLTLARASIDQSIYPTRGSSVTLSLNLTPPYSLFGDRDYDNLTTEEKYKWVEYHKWRFNVDWYVPLDRQKKLVFRAAAKFGFLGSYNKELGLAPFERFEVGGNGLPQNITLFGTTSISQRGYNIYSQNGGDALFNKFTMELRYPLSKNPQATIYALMFMEAGNSYQNFREYNPFKLNKSVGIGLRAFLPFFGLLGFDYGVRFDSAPGSPITPANGFFDYIGKNGEFSIILGFEPE
jgi:outer membrane protein insertion porin family